MKLNLAEIPIVKIARKEEPKPKGLYDFRPIIPAGIYQRRTVMDADIRPGRVFVWEPDLPYARELLVVTRFEGERVWTRSFPDYGKEVFNDLDRFREACFPTIFKDMPTEP
jgi:hypothetical protein